MSVINCRVINCRMMKCPYTLYLQAPNVETKKRVKMNQNWRGQK